MITILSFVLIIPLVIVPLYAQRWLFKDSIEGYDRELELYQESYD